MGHDADRGPDVNINDLTLAFDWTAAAEVAAAHHEAPRVGGPLAYAAYARLVSESDHLFMLITRARPPTQVCFSRCPSPYCSSDELITSITQDRVLEVTTVARERDRLHPVMGCEVGGAYDRFRAVHDILGHGHLNVGFGREGEYAAWRYQERLHSPLARLALATELHAEHSVRWTTGGLAEHKAVVLDERVIERSRAGRAMPNTVDGSATVAVANPPRRLARIAA
jgi:hypothetical protein